VAQRKIKNNTYLWQSISIPRLSPFFNGKART